MDRRMHTRINLKHPIPCTCRVGQDEPMSATIVNVSVMGIMLEVPDLQDKLTMESCQRIAVDEYGMENGSLFSGFIGTTNWVYKTYVGVCFEHPIKGSNKELRSWLRDNDQLCEEAS